MTISSDIESLAALDDKVALRAKFSELDDTVKYIDEQLAALRQQASVITAEPMASTIATLVSQCEQIALAAKETWAEMHRMYGHLAYPN